MDRMLTPIVKEASPAERRMLGSVKLEGQNTSDTKLKAIMICSAMVSASGERPNSATAIRFANSRAVRFMIQAPT